jgi:hypothetical protein
MEQQKIFANHIFYKSYLRSINLKSIN